MLIDYINKALSKAEYDKLEDGSFSGRIPERTWIVSMHLNPVDDITKTL